MGQHMKTVLETEAGCGGVNPNGFAPRFFSPFLLSLLGQELAFPLASSISV